jgi:hypothetical protein
MAFNNAENRFEILPIADLMVDSNQTISKKILAPAIPPSLLFPENKFQKIYKTYCNYSIKKVYKLFPVRYSYNKVEENHGP